MKYDAAIQTLKITNTGWTIKANDFMQTTYISRDAFVLLSGIIPLMKNDYHLEFSSKFGKFIPYLDQKQGIKMAVPSLHIKWEEPTPAQATWSNLKNDFNDEEVANDSDGTAITISPINEQTLSILKDHFSFTQDWDKVLNADGDYLLIDNTNRPNKVFVDGIAKEYTQDANPGLLYSYDLSSNFTKKIHDYHNNNWYVQRAICIVIYKLSDEDKKLIYPTILNNENCLEWTYLEVQRIIVEYLNKQVPGKYAICDENINPAQDVIELVRQTGTTIVPVASDLYAKLKDKIPTVYEVMQDELAVRYSKPGLSNSDLSPCEQKNLQLLKEFLNYFAHHFDSLRKWLSANDLQAVQIDVVDDLPEHWATYSYNLEEVIIDRTVLCDAGKTFNAALTAMGRGFSFDLEEYEFDALWNETSINFFASLKCNHCNCKDSNASKTEDNE